MDKNEYVAKNRTFIEKMLAKFRRLAIFSTVPKFISSVGTAKKIAKIFGYSSLVTFIRDIQADADRVANLYGELDPEQQAEVDRLYNEVFVPQSEDLNAEFEKGEKILNDVEIPVNVVNALTDPTDDDDDDDSDDEDDEDDGIFGKLKNFLIDNLFDGVDPADSWNDDDDSDDKDDKSK